MTPNPILETLLSRAAALNRRIVLPEAATDERTLRAAALLLERRWARPVLIGRREDFRTSAEVLRIDIKDAETIWPVDDPRLEQIVNHYQSRRAKEGLSNDQIRAQLLRDPVLFGAGLVGMGAVDGMTAGATTSTADVLRASLKLVGTAPGVKTLSSFFLMIFPQDAAWGHQGVLVFTDCAVIPDPDSAQLADIAWSAVASASRLLPDFTPRVAFLSFSTRSSAKHPLVDKVLEATKIFREKHPEVACDGELQADAALVAAVGERKAPGSSVAGKANILVFPDLNAGNIGYKLVERLAGAQALGPLLSGLDRPVNDLSRGASVEDVARVAALTGLQA